MSSMINNMPVSGAAPNLAAFEGIQQDEAAQQVSSFRRQEPGLNMNPTDLADKVRNQLGHGIVGNLPTK